MDQHALDVLNFSEIKKDLRSYITSKLTENLIENLEPSIEIDYIKERQKEVTQAKKILIRENTPPISGVKDIRPSLEKAEKSMIIDGEELLDITTTLEVGHDISSYFSNLEDEDDNYKKLMKIAAKIGNFRPLTKEIRKAIDNQGEVKSSASSKLRRIRRKIQNAKDSIRDKLNSIIHSSSMQKYIQEAVVTIRDGRYVIPVKVEHQGEINGLVHDQSSSGQTVFIEPNSVVKINNKLKQLEAEEEQEIQRILQELTFLVQAETDDIKITLKLLTALDFIIAKARYSLNIDGSEPLLNEEQKTKLFKARHPLLTGDVVPIDVELGDEFDTLVITGPNTGGKTVTLKTIGLLTLMAQAGLHIPALSGSEVGIYHQIYGDIGDEQSIKQNLSTFSSHMNQIIKIIEEADDTALVLLDELGAGTDPTEGAALGMAILDYLHTRNVKTVITTHYSQLKTYAYNNSGVENASVEFDVETLKPTYNLQMGLPGRSNAFQIANRLGLKDEIISSAEDFLDQEDIEIDDIIKEIEEDKKEYQSKKEEATEDYQQAKEMREEYEEKLKKLEERKNRELKEAYREADKIIKRAKDRAENIISDLKEKQRLSDREIQEARSGLREERKDIKSERNQLTAENQQEQEIPDLEEGDQVKIKNVNKNGKVVSLNQDKEEAVVQSGIMKVTVDLKELEKVEKEESSTPKGKVNISRVKQQKAKNISSKLDLRGMRAVDAKDKLLKYLDDVMLSNLNQVEIVHGKGTGVLREVVDETLDNYPSIKNYRLGKPKEGGSGVTIAKLEA
ncbi:endonuclease MutS2 [Halanaerobacter jeridensis]|uniref:Endonuclease MutS2 n=1 Tax=Halanaerobacter jeridensis TaxID=706427 RepID=A0A938XRV5_9FIRM|nr:endonuclease MutS2 [Halanaerobacter jeridensis]MBM7556531.1 DNA mismatch repair protein MutS2 [Halanaerobacter jeridensis]